MLGASLLVAILLSVSGGGSTGDTAHAVQDGAKYVKVSPDASATEYGLLATPDATAMEYGLL
ncbi:hypothetical protein [Streptomyces monashensis]|uniref:Uncharacterized protein n=1 Tax=Streptomyces monashensis TaxID=1678012 RepID=A0A1S2QH95_9ACTN|nr:hypothetical protein [Streptomyces monashensis]OIK04836.1 hypothetical protein BIV23_15940 [Streptomyces monashensis]